MPLKEKSQKQLQVAELFKREIADIFLKDDIFINKNFELTVSEADISPDLKNIKVFINIFGDINAKSLIEELNKNSHYFKNRIVKKIKVRNVPQIKFLLDESTKNAIKMDKNIEEEGKKL